MQCSCLLSLFLAGILIWQAQAMPRFSGQLRLKRSMKQQTLDDPGDCVKQCLSDHTSGIREISARFKLMLIQKVKALGLPDNAGANNPQVTQAAISNVHDMLDEMCKRSDTTKSCVQGCPKSDLQQVALLAHVKDREVVCYPVNKVQDFNAFSASENCSKIIRDQKPCDKQCGAPLSVDGATGFTFNEQEAEVNYETDKKKNADAAAKACKSLKCHTDCMRPLLTKQCSQSAFDDYVRGKKYEPQATLAILRYLNALGPNDPPECADYQ